MRDQLGILKICDFVSVVEISESRKEMFLRSTRERKRIWSMNLQQRIGGSSWGR